MDGVVPVDGVDGQDEVNCDECGELNPNLRPDGKPRFRSVQRLRLCC